MIIRPATPEDAHEVAGIKVDSWKHAYRNIVPESVRSSITQDEVRKKWLGVVVREFSRKVLVAENKSRLVGYAMFGAVRGCSHGHSGQLYEIYVLPSIMDKGFGSALFRAASERLFNDGHESLLLWVFAANLGARRFYERLGGQLIADAKLVTEIGGERLPEVAYGFRPLPVPTAKR